VHSPAGRHPVVKATLWMMGALASFMAMAIGGREMAARRMTSFEILLFRSLVGLVIVSVLLARSGWGQISVKRFGLHFARNAAAFGGQCGWFYGIALFPLAEGLVLDSPAQVCAR